MMHQFDYSKSALKVMEPEVVSLMMTVQEYKGRMRVREQDAPALLENLREIAKIQSTEASNRIEGIVTTSPRLKALVQQKTTPRNRSEEEIAGYRDVLNTVHENYQYISPLPSFILQMHRDLYAYSGRGGEWKRTDNIISETDARGNRHVRFEPVPAYRTADAMESLCSAFRDALQNRVAEPLVLIPLFILDFLCIHPFSDGNGRMGRLLTTLLLNRCGYDVGRYVSLEHIIDSAKEGYYGSLQASSAGWHGNKADYVPFVRYFLGVLVKAYAELESRMKDVGTAGISKPDRVKALFAQSLGPLKKSDIVEKCPDISLITISRTLRALQGEGYIVRIGKGRATAYVRAEQ